MTKTFNDKDGGAQCVADNEDDEREILLYPGTKSKSGDMEILRILQISSQSDDGTKLKLCQEPFANSSSERTPIKHIDSTVYALLSLVRSLGKRYTRYLQKQKFCNKVSVGESILVCHKHGFVLSIFFINMFYCSCHKLFI